MKGVVFSVLFSLLFIFNVSSQEAESLTYFDPVQNKYVTSRVMYIGWEHHCITISNSGTQSARILTYSSMRVTPEFAANRGQRSEWTEWELINTEPQPYADINSLILRRNTARDHYRMYPISGRQVGTTLLRIVSPPDNSSNPVWFDENNDLNLFFKAYMVLN
jgi:hypothetical protein